MFVAADAVAVDAVAVDAVVTDAVAGQAQAHRCTECRKVIVAAASARATQRVCSKECRRVRDRKLARSRRRRDLEATRAEERERQRASRERRREASGCHAPPLRCKCLLSEEEISHLVDRALAVSRATLVRDFQAILERCTAKCGEAWQRVTHEPPASNS